MRIAITGGIAEGKSTVLAYLSEFGYSTASSDLFARGVFHDPEVQAGLGALLGVRPPVTAEALRVALSGSDSVRRAVNRLMHPAVVSKISQSDATFFEVPLLIETCLQPLFDFVWVVTCGPQEQLRRLTARYGEEAASKLAESQLETAVKVPFGDVIVRTNEETDTVQLFVEDAVRRTLSGWIAPIRG